MQRDFFYEMKGTCEKSPVHAISYILPNTEHFLSEIRSKIRSILPLICSQHGSENRAAAENRTKGQKQNLVEKKQTVSEHGTITYIENLKESTKPLV